MKKLIKEIEELTKELNFNVGGLQEVRYIIEEEGATQYAQDQLSNLTNKVSNLTLKINKKQNQLFTQLNWLGK